MKTLSKKPSNISVSIYFGKKDNILLYLLYDNVASSDFNFIVKATLKHYVNNSTFNIHHYINLKKIIELYDEIKDDDCFEVKKQRNIIILQTDDFIYDWIQTINETKRPQLIKEILCKRIEECIEEVKNPQNNKENSPYQKNQPIIIIPGLADTQSNAFDYQSWLNQASATKESNVLEESKPINRGISKQLNPSSLDELRKLKGSPFGQLGKQ